MQRLSRLDGLRGVLAVYVMLGHALPFTVLPDWARRPFSHGEAAVDLFFALSGLVIVFSLAQYSGRFWPFMAARARRLLPVYFVVLAGALAVISLGAPALPWVVPGSPAWLFWAPAPPPHFFWHVAAHALLLHGLIPQGVLPYVWVTVLGPAWSLSTEWQFYVVIALVLPRLPGGSRLGRFALGMLALGVGYRLAAPHLPAFWQFSRAFLPDAAPYFALGLASAVWLRGGGWGLLLGCVLVTIVLGLVSSEPGRALIPLVWALVMAAQAWDRFPVLGPFFDSRLAQWLGAVSYPLYLLNEPVQRGLALLAGSLAHGDPGLFTWIWLPLAVTVPVLAAALLHGGVEMPVLRAALPANWPRPDFRYVSEASPVRKIAS
jgi:peptidoglycan/LPS O-acetylase OafA/YrhL